MVKKEMMKSEEKKYDKFAIASFVISLISIFLILANPISPFHTLGYFIFPLPWIFYLLTFILILIIELIIGIASLIRMKKNYNLKGRKFAWMGIIISVLGLILFIIDLIALFGGAWGG